MKRVAVVHEVFAKAPEVFSNSEHFQCLSAPEEEEKLSKFITEHQIEHTIIGVDMYSGPLYAALKKGSVIARFGVGHDGVDKEIAAEHGLYCTNTPEVLDDSVSEFAVGLLISAARSISQSTYKVRTNEWGSWIGNELKSKTVAVIGCGAIGKKTASILRKGFKMTVIGFDIMNPGMEDIFSKYTNRFEDAVENADFITLHIPYTENTENFIDFNRLCMMKNSAIIINTSRGGVLNENDLYDALQKGIIAGAGLDVFKNEPYYPQSPEKDLRLIDQIIMSPHIGSSTKEACRQMALRALQNLRLCEEGKFHTMDLV